jgi:uncharacterized protein YdhG (YjbR/CyaY superfamily)
MGEYSDLIDAAPQPAAVVLRAIRDAVLAAAPEAEEGISYGVPAYRYRGRPLIGVGTNAKGYSLFPFSGSIVSSVAADLVGFRVSKGAIGFTADQPVPGPVVDKIIGLRLAELGMDRR